MSKKKKLLIIAGAGASVSFGMPSVEEIHNNFSVYAKENYLLVSNPAIDLYSYIFEEITRYLSVHGKGRSVNFENILYAIYSLASTYPAGFYTAPLAALVQRKEFPEIFYANKKHKVDEYMLRNLASDLIDKLLEDIRKKCSQPEKQVILKLQTFNQFLKSLQDQFEIAVVTLNYDNLLHCAMPNLETGFDLKDNGIFKPERIFNRNSWGCILHLHGSVHFDMQWFNGSKDLHQIVWQSDLSQKFNPNSSGRGTKRTIEGNVFPTSNIIVGYGKTEQIQGFPFRTYYSELDRLVHSSDGLLFLGYSFSDQHVNEIFYKYRNPFNRPVVVIDYIKDDDDAVKLLTTSSGSLEGPITARRALSIFDTHSSLMLSNGNRIPKAIINLKKEKDFERSSDINRKLSLWYNGMYEACQYPEKIIDELLM